MNINLTLLMQMFTFFIFVVLMMKLVWPKISAALEARRKQISEGLAAAERGQRDLEVAQQKVKSIIQEAKVEAATIIEQANERGRQITDAARQEGLEHIAKMKSVAEAEIERAQHKARDELQTMVADLVVAGTEKLLAKNVDKAANKALINRWLKEV